MLFVSVEYFLITLAIKATTHSTSFVSELSSSRCRAWASLNISPLAEQHFRTQSRLIGPLRIREIPCLNAMMDLSVLGCFPLYKNAQLE